MNVQRLVAPALYAGASGDPGCEYARQWVLEYCRQFLAACFDSWQDAVDRGVVDRKALEHLAAAELSGDSTCANLLALVHSSAYLDRQAFLDRHRDLLTRIGTG